MAEEKENPGKERCESGGPPSRATLSPEEEGRLPAEVAAKWRQLDAYADYLEKKTMDLEAETNSVRAAEERGRSLLADLTHRDRVLVRRLAHKDQEILEYVAQVAELKAAQASGPAALRSSVLDPAVNILLLRLRQELAANKTKLEETQSELSAWKFTPDSNTGKRLMAKCHVLYQENEELGKSMSSGRMAKLEGDLALQKSFSEEVKKSQSELDEFLTELDEDVEGMQGTIYFLQQELRKAREELACSSNNATTTNSATERTTDSQPSKEGVSSLTNGGGDESSEIPDAEEPVSKKARRGSQVSLDYNEGEFEGLTNGDSRTEQC